MTHRSRSRSSDPEPAHPLEKVIQEVSADSFEEDFGVREDMWAQKVRRELDAKLAGLRRRLNPARSPELLARLDALQQTPEIRIAHLELAGLTTEDLRLLVAELEATVRTQELPK